MDTIRKTILISLISISAISWVFSNYQPDMMKAMMTYDPIAVSLFTISWTVGMAAMMFPSITPMVLLYNRLIRVDDDSRDNTKDDISYALVVEWDESPRRNLPLPIFHSFLNIIFVGSYLAIWAITGIALLLAWSILMNNLLTHFETRQQFQIVYGIIMIISGIYQFTSLKRKCLGYCGSPKSFFMKRWGAGVSGAVKMGTYHGLSCLGCCWPYFLIMVALGWMNILWMGLFAGIIFGEKMWLRGGIWISKSTGIGLAIIGIMAMLGLVTISTGMNNTGDNNDMHTSNLSHNYKKDDMIGMNQYANNISSTTKGDNTITTKNMSNMKGM
jgi:predicted metal-binding membrane protein